MPPSGAGDVLGDPARFTGEQVAAAAGLPPAEAGPLWRAMGFPDTGDSAVFTRGDVEALSLLAEWTRSGVLDSATAVELVRGLGQTTARLAAWQLQTLAAADRPSADPDGGAAAASVTPLVPGLEALLLHAWRRHLASGLTRDLSAPPLPERTSATGSIGFADIAGFTRMSRVSSDDRVAGLVRAFESGAADVVASHGARLVKTLGDEVMFLADDADTAVAVAVAMHRMAIPAPDPVRLRIGVATGPLVMQMGDVYGATVNRASRLTAVARPGGTLLDNATAESMTRPGRYLVRHHRPRALRGLGLVRTASVTARAGDR